MSQLRIYAEAEPAIALVDTTDPALIQAQLHAVGIQFEQWHASAPLTADSTPEQILQSYAEPINRLKAQGGYQAVDVISLSANHPDKVVLRQKFLAEHQHSEDEVRFFVRGQGLFCLHLGDKVYQVLCQQQDLISVPANTPHWFDMGSQPDFSAIRLFTNPDGWVANYTGSDIARRFALLP